MSNTLFALPPRERMGAVLTLPGNRNPTPASAQIQIEDLRTEIVGIRETMESMIAKKEARIIWLAQIIEKGYQG